MRFVSMYLFSKAKGVRRETTMAKRQNVQSAVTSHSMCVCFKRFKYKRTHIHAHAQKTSQPLVFCSDATFAPTEEDVLPLNVNHWAQNN